MIGVFTKTRQLLAPVSGRVVPLRGGEYRGIAVIPTDTKIYAPAAGVVSIREGSRLEVFVNAARGTIELRGGFTSHIKKGSRVKEGDLIAMIDLDLLKNGGYMTQVCLLLPGNGMARQVDAEWVHGGKSRVIMLV